MQPVSENGASIHTGDADVTRRMEQALIELPELQREIFRLSAQEGLTYHEISYRLMLSIPAVQRHLIRALRYLDYRVNSGR